MTCPDDAPRIMQDYSKATGELMLAFATHGTGCTSRKPHLIRGCSLIIRAYQDSWTALAELGACLSLPRP